MSTTQAYVPSAGDTIRAKWTIDGATTLEQAAQQLEKFAHELRELHQQGWTLQQTIEDDYGFLVDPQGNQGNTWDEEDEDWDFGDEDEEDNLDSEKAQEKELIDSLKI